MSRSLLSEDTCPNLCVYMVFMNINFLNTIFDMWIWLFFFVFSFTELPLCASKHFSMIFLIIARIEDVFIRRKALKKVHRLLTFLGFKVSVFYNLRFQTQETDELNVAPALSNSYEGRPSIYTGRVLCQICFAGCLKVH